MEIRLLPKKPISWFIWIGLLAVCLPRYYSSFPFPQLISQYEAEMWTRPREIPHDNNQWSVTVRAPKAIADFTDAPMSVSVRNTQSSPANAQVTVTLKCRDGDNVCNENIAYGRALVRDSTQSSVFLENIPANGEVITWFDLRAVAQIDRGFIPVPDIKLDADVIINQSSVFQRHEVFVSSFNRDRVFRLWAIENLLSPPGSNIVVPIFFLFIVVIFEITFDVIILFRTGKAQDELKEMYCYWPLGARTKIMVIVRWLISLMLMIAAIILIAQLVKLTPLAALGPFFTADPVNVQIRLVIFRFILGALGLGVLFGTVSSTHKS